MRTHVRLSVFLVAGFSLIFTACHAQTKTDRRDGNWWQTLDRRTKLVYMVGFIDGTKLGANMSAWRSVNTNQHAADAARDSYKQYFTKYLPDAVTNDRIVEGLDEFYRDELNRGITINSAAWVVLKQAANDPKPEIDNLIQNLRKNNL